MRKNIRQMVRAHGTHRADVNCFFADVIRHVGDRGQNYKTQVVVWIVYSSITPDYIKCYRE